MRDPVRAWLFGIARRAAMDRLRRHYAEPAAEAEPDDTPAPDDTEGLAEEIELMHEELAHLPIVEREVLVLFYLQELTLTEVSAVLAVPVGTVKSRLFRARRMLRNRLVERGIQP